MARCFLTQLQKSTPDKKVPRQCEVFEKHVKPSLGREKIAYVRVDELRFERGWELASLLKEGFEVDLYAALAAVPTITEIGMAALLHSAHSAAKVVSEIQRLTTPPEVKVERVRVSDFFSGSFESVDQVKEAVARLQDHLIKLLDEGVKIVVE